jgi:hypothetical protein
MRLGPVFSTEETQFTAYAGLERSTGLISPELAVWRRFSGLGDFRCRLVIFGFCLLFVGKEKQPFIAHQATLKVQDDIELLSCSNS